MLNNNFSIDCDTCTDDALVECYEGYTQEWEKCINKYNNYRCNFYNFPPSSQDYPRCEIKNTFCNFVTL